MKTWQVHRPRATAYKITWLAASAALGAASAANAHHGFGTFAMNEDVEITGVVTELAFVNPHSWVYLDVTQEDGSVIDFRCEMRSATTLRRSGWTPEMFPVGARITIQGSPDRTDPKACYVSTVVFADGSSIDRYGQRTPPTRTPAQARAERLPSGEPNIYGDWAAEQVVMTDPRGQRGTLVPLSSVDEFEPGGVPEGQRAIPGARGTPEADEGVNPFTRARARPAVVPLTEAGERAMASLPAVPLTARSCRTTSIVADWAGEPVNRISRSGEAITLQYGRLGLERTIHMDMSEHPAAIVPSRAGHSIGRWEDDVLVVDTVGFEPGLLMQTTPHSDQLHVVERFSLDPERSRLTRSYTAEDPVYYTAPYTGSDVLLPSDVPFNPEPCQDLTPVAPPAPAP